VPDGDSDDGERELAPPTTMLAAVPWWAWVNAAPRLTVTPTTEPAAEQSVDLRSYGPFATRSRKPPR